MDIETILKEELKGFNENTIVLLSVTANEIKNKLTVLPLREGLGRMGVSFLIGDIFTAKKCLEYLDGRIKNIYVDVERKKEYDIYEVATRTVKVSKVFQYKPNDVTLESTDLLLRERWKDEFYNKNILVYGSGNLAGKIALRLAERGSQVIVIGRNEKNRDLLINGLNAILPKFSNKILSGDPNEIKDNSIDCIISFVSAKQVIGEEYLRFVKFNGIAIDGGIGNFNNDFINQSHEKGIQTIRLDVRIAFIYSIINTNNDVKNFFINNIGEKIIHNLNLVSGGIIGKEGDIIVDSISLPKQIIGVANGFGGIKSEICEREKVNIQTIKKEFNI